MAANHRAHLTNGRCDGVTSTAATGRHTRAQDLSNASCSQRVKLETKKEESELKFVKHTAMKDPWPIAVQCSGFGTPLE